MLWIVRSQLVRVRAIAPHESLFQAFAVFPHFAKCLPQILPLFIVGRVPKFETLKLRDKSLARAEGALNPFLLRLRTHRRRLGFPSSD